MRQSKKRFILEPTHHSRLSFPCLFAKPTPQPSKAQALF